MAMNLHISLRNKILSEYCEFRKSQEQLQPKEVYENAIKYFDSLVQEYDKIYKSKEV